MAACRATSATAYMLTPTNIHLCSISQPYKAPNVLHGFTIWSLCCLTPLSLLGRWSTRRLQSAGVSHNRHTSRTQSLDSRCYIYINDQIIAIIKSTCLLLVSGSCMCSLHANWISVVRVKVDFQPTPKISSAELPE